MLENNIHRAKQNKLEMHAYNVNLNLKSQIVNIFDVSWHLLILLNSRICDIIFRVADTDISTCYVIELKIQKLFHNLKSHLLLL